MALSNQEIVDALKEKSLLETSELVKMIEEAFGVSAAAAAVAMPMGAAAGGGEAAAAAEEKSEFDVILQAAGGNRHSFVGCFRLSCWTWMAKMRSRCSITPVRFRAS